jgi:hypothetical protein
MVDETNISAQVQYADLLSKVKSMEPYLQLLHHDYLLMVAHDIRFTYAIDFHDVWNYAEPLSMLLSIHQKRRHQIPDDEAFKRQIARSKLLFDPGSKNRCVLLPPYLDELKNKFNEVTKKILEQGVSGVDKDFLHQLEKIADNDIVQNTIDEFQNNGSVSPNLLAKFPSFLETNVRELLYYISGVANQGLDIINDVLFSANSKLKVASSLWPEAASLISKITKNKSSEWYRDFSKMRPNPESDASNLYDAKAIDLILSINEYLLTKREFLVLVSGASTMKKFFRRKVDNLPANYIVTKEDGLSISASQFDEVIPLFRPIETYYYLTLFFDKTDEDVLHHLGDELDRINQVYILGESIKKLQPTCDECITNQKKVCTFSKSCHSIHIQKQILGHKEHFDQYENVLLAENRLSVIEPAWEKITAQQNEFASRLNKTTLKLIEYLASRRNNLDENLYLREENLQESMEEQIRSALHSITDVTFYQDEIGSGLEKFTRTRYRINFNDKEIEDLLNKVESARDIGDTKLLSQSIRQLIDRAYEEKLKSKKQLLWAVLLLCHGLYDRTIELMVRTLNTETLDNAKEYYYVRALAHYVKGDFKQVIADCKENIGNYQDDPRFYHLCGLAAGMLVVTGTNISDDVSWSVAIDYEKDAYDLVEKNATKDENFLSAIINNLAYFYCRRNNLNDLEQATKWIRKLKEISPSFDKSPEDLNTRGWVNKMCALNELNNEKRIEYATQALQDFRQSRDLAMKIGVEKKEIDQYDKDLREAEQQLKDIIP